MKALHQQRRGFFSYCLLVACCLTLSGCFGGLFSKTVLPVDSGKPVAQQMVTVPDAEAALKAGQTARAEQIATRLMAQQLSQSDMARAARVLALSASANSHPYLAMTALDRWLAAAPGADGAAEWQGVFFNTLNQLPPHDAIARAQKAMTHERPFKLRTGAAVFAASKQWERRRGAPAALANLQAFYVQAQDVKDRAYVENTFFTFLQGVDASSLAQIEPLVTEENSKAFPYAVISFEALRRKAFHESYREEAQAEAAVLAQGTLLADPSILGSWDARETAPVAVPTTVPLAGRTLVLALPLSGGLSSIGKKVVAGAEEACKEFTNAGHSVGLVKIDTDNPGWTETLASLPEKAVIVGGPLRLEDLNAAQSKGLTNRRVFMTFMPSLADSGDEGRVAWRFFPSAEDQLAALFSAARKLDITQFAIMMPDNDPYAARMAELFTSYVHAGGGQVVNRLEYPAKEPDKWNKLVGSFLGTHKKANRAPATPFRAVFLPDSWRNMELIVPNLFYFLESRQVLLGTSLWEQGLAASDHVPAHYYKMAVFPGAWNKASNNQATQQLHTAYARSGKEPDFWAALGYDFVRYASMLDIQPGWNAATVNAAVSRNYGMAWSMAPISWSSRGKASQNLFLFSPIQEGYAPANMQEIESSYKKAWKIR
ncbi:MAG: hypothetical protein DELT_02377 [Desulfovibrio sp.]